MNLRRFVLTLFALVGASSWAHSMPVGYHEFAIFGSHSIYLSHYAMFSSLHAYQAIVEVELRSDDHDAAQRFLDHRAHHPGLHYTFSPYRKVAPGPNRVKDQDDWVLPEKMQVGQTFNGDIHYRQNKVDTTLDYNVTAEVKRVIAFSMLDPSFPRPTGLTYFLFGDSTEAYLAHDLSAPPNPGEQIPDFDQILAVSILGNGELAQFSGEAFTIPGRENVDGSALKTGESARLESHGQRLNVRVDGELLRLSVMTER